MNERSSNGAGSIVCSIVLQILWKHDLEVVQMTDFFLSKMTPRLRAESTGASMT